jgi:hypothetical protein
LRKHFCLCNFGNFQSSFKIPLLIAHVTKYKNELITQLRNCHNRHVVITTTYTQSTLTKSVLWGVTTPDLVDIDR